MLAAIASMVALVARRRDHDRNEEHYRIEVMQSMTALVRTSHQTELEQVSARIDARLLRVEPLRQTWNVLRLFGVAYAETRWTQWFAAIRAATPDLDARIARGEPGAVFDWLRTNIWSQASRWPTAELATRATGEVLNPLHFRRHLEVRYLS